MTRLLTWFSIERTAGLVMLGIAGLLILRPSATGLQVLNELYGIQLSISVLTGVMIVFGIILMLYRRTSFLVFLILLMPKILYALCLFWVFLLREDVGPFGFTYGFLSCGLWLYIHTRREPPPTP